MSLKAYLFVTIHRLQPVKLFCKLQLNTSLNYYLDSTVTTPLNKSPVNNEIPQPCQYVIIPNSKMPDISQFHKTIIIAPIINASINMLTIHIKQILNIFKNNSKFLFPFYSLIFNKRPLILF